MLLLSAGSPFTFALSHTIIFPDTLFKTHYAVESSQHVPAVLAQYKPHQLLSPSVPLLHELVASPALISFPQFIFGLPLSIVFISYLSTIHQSHLAFWKSLPLSLCTRLCPHRFLSYYNLQSYLEIYRPQPIQLSNPSLKPFAHTLFSTCAISLDPVRLSHFKLHFSLTLSVPWAISFSARSFPSFSTDIIFFYSKSSPGSVSFHLFLLRFHHISSFTRIIYKLTSIHSVFLAQPFSATFFFGRFPPTFSISCALQVHSSVFFCSSAAGTLALKWCSSFPLSLRLTLSRSSHIFKADEQYQCI